MVICVHLPVIFPNNPGPRPANMAEQAQQGPTMADRFRIAGSS